MGKLTFVGLGLGETSGICAYGLAAARASDVVYAEFYTSRLVGQDPAGLSGAIGKEVVELSRVEVEDGARILDSAAAGSAALLTAGDPMAATTHVDLRLRALDRGIDVEIVHSSSILTAAPGLLGLQHYKFGRTTTVPFPRENYAPTSPYKAIESNLAVGLHTLVLLDIDAENCRYMTASQGLRELLAMEAKEGRGVLQAERLACVVARAGGKDVAVFAGEAGKLAEMDFGEPLHCIVIPGELHFMEEEALQKLCKWEK